MFRFSFLAAILILALVVLMGAGCASSGDSPALGALGSGGATAVATAAPACPDEPCDAGACTVSCTVEGDVCHVVVSCDGEPCCSITCPASECVECDKCDECPSGVACVACADCTG